MNTNQHGCTDEELKAHLRSRSDWGEPWDQWGHVLTQLRKGRIYIQVDGTPPKWLPKCGFLDGIKISQLPSAPRPKRFRPKPTT